MAQVLIADDSYIVRESLKKILAQSEHKVVAEASNGEEAYLKYRMYRPDLVTMDINMPGMNGIDTVKKIKHEFPDANIVMISTLGFQDHVFEAIKVGPDTILSSLLTMKSFFLSLILSSPPPLNKKENPSYVDTADSLFCYYSLKMSRANESEKPSLAVYCS